MSTAGIALHRPAIGRIMRIPGDPAITLTRIAHGERLAWQGAIAGEAWILSQPFRGSRDWQGVTADELTATPRLKRQARVIRWILEHQPEWKAALVSRRTTPA